MAETVVTGRCFCGAVRFAFDHQPLAVRACWCRDCQYLACGNASVNAVFRLPGMRMTGETGDHASTADSGNAMRRRFCLACGTPLFSQSSARPELIVVRVGALENPESYRPQGFIWTGSAPGWGHVDADLPCWEGQPPPAAPDAAGSTSR